MDARRIIAVAVLVVIGSLMLHGKEINVNVQRFVIAVLVMLAGAVVLSGCAEKQNSIAGIIVEPTELSIGRPTRNFPVATADGQQTSFGELREPVAIVAFVSPNESQCCGLNPRLISLAEDLGYKRITIAQISEPTDKCKHGPGCAADCNLEASHLVSLCDTNHIAWNAYFRPEPNTVVLVDSRGEVVAVSSLANLDAVADKARRLANEVEAFEESAYES